MPGIPLAIARPELRVVLLDSNSKKSAFLRQAAIELELANIAVHCGRVEAYRPADAFAVITARAFADLAELVRLSRHLLQAGGHWLAMKGVCPQAEIARLPADVVVDAYIVWKCRGSPASGIWCVISSVPPGIEGELIWQEYSR
jgi:16S rRNA (guanine527-N7)-methyltransferase